MSLEPVGFRATIEGFQSYISQVGAMNSADQEMIANSLKAAQAAETETAALLAKARAASTAAAGTAEAAVADERATAAAVAYAAAQNEAAAAAAKASSSTTALTGTLKNAGVAAVALVAAYVGMSVLDNIIKKTTQLAEETEKLQLVTGLSAEKASGLIYAADKEYVSYDQLSAGLRIFSRNLAVVQEANDGFTGGAKTTTEILKSMGISATDANGHFKDTYTLLGEVADRFEAMGKTAEGAQLRAGLAAQLFGRNGAALLPLLSQGAAGMAQLQAEAERLGVTLNENDVKAAKELHDNLVELHAAVTGLELEVGNKAVPVLANLAQQLSNVLTGSGKAGEFERDVKEIFDAISSLTGVGDALKTALGAGIDFALEPFRVLRDGIRTVMDLINGDWGKAWQDFKKLGTDLAQQAFDALLIMSGGFANKFIDVIEAAVNGGIDALNSINGKVNIAGHNFNPFSEIAIPNVSIPRIPTPDLSDITDALSGLGRSGKDATGPVNDAAGGLRNLAGAATDASETLAGAALKAAEAAAQAVFAQPTREEADLNLSLAQQQLSTDQATQVFDPQIRNLEDQLKSLNEKASSAEQAAQDHADAIKANDEAQISAIQDAAAAQKDAAQAAQDNAQNALQQAQNAAAAQNEANQRQQILLQQQLSALQKNASDLQAAFIAQNEALQEKINAAIGRGDTAGALSLVAEQKQQTAQYRGAAASNTAQQEGTTGAIKSVEEQGRLDSLAASASMRALKTATDAQTKSAKEAGKSIDDGAKTQVKALKAEEKAADDAAKGVTKSYKSQETALQKHIDTLKLAERAETDKTKAIQDQIKLEDDRKAILKAQLVSANDALLTDKQQADLVKNVLIPMIHTASDAYKASAERLGFSLIPEIDKAAAALKDELTYGADTSAEQLKELKTAAQNAAAAVTTAGSRIGAALDSLAVRIGTALKTTTPAGTGTAAGNSVGTSLGNGKTAGGAVGVIMSRSEGGLITMPELARLHPPEMILPLSNPGRTRELLASLPPGLFASLAASRQQRGDAGSIFGDLNVQGYTLEDMEATAHRAVSAAFSRARQTSRRAGAVVGQAIGAGSF